MPNNGCFTRLEAKRALKILDRALDTEEGFQFALESGAAAGIFSSLLILDDYLTNSKAKPLVRERSREDIYAQQVRQGSTDISQVGASAL